MKTSLLLPVVALAFLSVAKAADKTAGEPPAQFLQTHNSAARRALATKITADFRDAPIRDVVDFLVHAAQMNTVMKLDADPTPDAGAPREVGGKIPGASVEAAQTGATSAPRNEPKITRKFEGVPLRTVYYLLSKDTGLTIEWRLYEGKPVGIFIRNQAADQAAGEPPVNFLQTDDPLFRRDLATKITADFRDAPIRDVIGYLVRAGNMSIVMKLDAAPSQAAGAPKKADETIPGAPVEAAPAGASSAPKTELRITRKFEGVPLRTVYYLLGKDTGLAVEWMILNNGKPVGIMIRN
jgi:hypothetical protein